MIFGRGGVKEYLRYLLEGYGGTVMLAYGGGSIKKNGVYDEITAIAASTNLTAGCCKKLSREEVLQIFQEAMG